MSTADVHIGHWLAMRGVARCPKALARPLRSPSHRRQLVSTGGSAQHHGVRASWGWARVRGACISGQTWGKGTAGCNKGDAALSGTTQQVPPPPPAPFVAYRMRCIDHACRIAGKPTIAIRCATCLVSLQRDAIATCGRRSMRLDADAARIAFWARRQILSFRARVRRHQAAGIPEHKSFGPSCLSGGSSVMWRTTLQVFGRSSPSKMLQVYADIA